MHISRCFKSRKSEKTNRRTPVYRNSIFDTCPPLQDSLITSVPTSRASGIQEQHDGVILIRCQVIGIFILAGS